LEGLTRIYGSTIAISELTLSRVENPDRFKHRFVDKVRVKGKMEPVLVHEVFDGDPKSVAELKELTKESFEKGISLYYDKKFSEASVEFNQVLQKNPDDKAARIYLERSATYMVKGVPDDWTGVETLTKK
jgi:two-component system sensor histidine kinase ChiS